MWHTSHVSKSSQVTSASHVTSGIPGSTSPLGDVIVPHHFGSLGIEASGVFKLAHFQFSRTLNSRTVQSVSMCPPGSNNQDSLRVFTRSPRICSTCPPQSYSYVLLRGSELRRSQTSTFFLENVFIWGS
jgi:hypothetical protein